MATVQEVRHKAGRMLGIVGYGIALGSSNDLLLTEAYTQVYDELKTEGINIWASDGTVPDRVAPHVAALMAFKVTEDIGTAEDRYPRIVAKYRLAMPEIRRLTAATYTNLDAPVDY